MHENYVTERHLINQEGYLLETLNTRRHLSVLQISCHQKSHTTHLLKIAAGNVNLYVRINMTPMMNVMKIQYSVFYKAAFICEE